MNCVFCAINSGKLPAHRLFEDEHFVVLLDIFPLRPAHVLIVSRQHAPLLGDLPVAARDALLPLAQRVSQALYASGLGIQGINLLINDGAAANQHVPHLHLHLIPRRGADLAVIGWRLLTRFLPLGRQRLERQLEQHAQILRNALQAQEAEHV